MPPRSFQAPLKYRPLDPQHEIRLLEVHPAASIDEPLHCRLVHVARADEVNYIGLSLLYGDAVHTESIHVNGAPLQVPCSVGEALRNMRGLFTPDKIDEFYGPRTYGLDRHSTSSTCKSISGNSPSSGNTGSSGASLNPSEHTKGLSKATTWLRNAFRGVKFGKKGGHGGGLAAAGSLHRSRSNNAMGQQPLWVWVDALCINSRNSEEVSHRRSSTAVAFREARLVVGWLGCKDEQATLALGFMLALADAAPALFGDSRHKKEHPEHYGPIMEFLAPLQELWVLPPGTKISDHPAYQALKAFMGRPYFAHNWILEELAFSTTPGFLVGTQYVSWLQVLRFICINEEVVERGSLYFPDEDRQALEWLPLGSLYFFLEDYNRRRSKDHEHEKD